MFDVFYLAPWQYQLLESRETIILSSFTLDRASARKFFNIAGNYIRRNTSTTVASRDRTLPINQYTLQNPKHFVECKNTLQNPKHIPGTQIWGVFLNLAGILSPHDLTFIYKSFIVRIAVFILYILNQYPAQD